MPIRQDRKISFIGGIILLVATLAAGISVYVVMQRQAETALSRNLQASLQSNVRLLEDQINRALTDTRTVTNRPYLIQNLQLLESESDNAKAPVELQRIASSFLLSGFIGLSVYDVRGNEVAHAGLFSKNHGQRVTLKTKDRASLLWDGKFTMQTSMDVLDQQGRRIGTVVTEINFPILTYIFEDAVSVGRTAAFAVCVPLEGDPNHMDCFLGTNSRIEFMRVVRTIEGKPLPMNDALNGGTGVILSKDYRLEQVVAAYRPLSSLGFGAVLKIDEAELYSPIIEQLKFIAPLLLALVATGMLLLNFLVTPLLRKLVRSEQAARDANVLVHNSETQLREITDAVPAWITYVDADQRFRFHNKAFGESLDLPYEQIKGKTLHEVLGDELYETVRLRVKEVLSGYPVVYERTQKTARRGLRDYVVSYFPRYGDDKEGRVLGFYALGTDITELKRIDRMKSEFVSTVSHELRTPLTSIRGSLGLIAGGVAGQLPEAVKTLVGIAKTNCERLIRLINDILDIEKIESGKMKLDLQAVDLKLLLAQALVANEGFGAAHKVGLSLHFPDDKVQVHVDSDRLMQVITNLLSNAIKFSPFGGTVEVHVSLPGTKVRIEVRDHGPGIPLEFRKRIFQKFSQADSSDTRQKGGTGLGLNISQAIVERLGGSIGFQTEVGAGSTFFIELPQWKGLPAAAVPATAHAAVRPRVLICEDDHDIARLICMMLDKGGFDADMVYSAAQAQAYLAQTPYAAITVDLKLPDQDGITLIRTLRRQESTRDLPIVVVSAKAGKKEMQANNQTLSVSGWLEKPIDENLLILSLRRAINGMAEGKPRILHVEDDLDIQRIAEAIAQDFAIFEFAATLQDARARLQARRFALVLLDLALAEGSGWDLLADIEALAPPPPVVVFSATEIDWVQSARVDAVLVKAQTSNDELQHTLRRVLKESRSLDRPLE
ncbi:ATP-binding protein [Polaromonas sp. SM01]|uniref:ATP-binding protein n=1 Tax=Polaromonas sp. SM01 TaxID=3085630 RepID=UPI002981EF30|nr:ATP-binding protein [Polaromonas sp. SM01]MDW5441663.1 ATP-binding protein [Polaromonas sp. SM01]